MEVNGKVKVGDEEYTITRFRGLKAILAGALFARVMKKMPTLQEDVLDFRKRFMKENALRITPGMAKLPRFMVMGLTPEDFIGAPDGVLEIPEEPTGQLIFMHIFPEAFELAQAEVTHFIALMVIPNKALEEADDADQVSEELDKIGKKLIRQGTIDEILEIVNVGMEVFQDQIVSKRDRLGKLQDLPFLRMLLSTPSDTTQMEEVETTTPSTDDLLGESTPPILMPDAPILSEDLPPSTDGQEETRSTESLGVNS
jgi:hypothetical protein